MFVAISCSAASSSSSGVAALRLMLEVEMVVTAARNSRLRHENFDLAS
jgi:hypothetical protein